MKKLLLLLLCVPLIGLGQTMIPDANFEQALINLGYDTGTPNGSVPTSSIDTVTSLDVISLNISDLTGIEDFADLIFFRCGNNQLTSLDVSNNTALTLLNCANNQLTTLDLSNNTALTDLWLVNNALTSLDLSNNTALTDLWCGGNQLSTLDVSNNTALTFLNCETNQLTSLDISNTSISYFHSPYYLKGNPNLSITANSMPQLSTFDTYHIQGPYTILELQINNNPLLTEIICIDNNLSILDVNNNPLLTSVNCYNNQLTTLDVSSNTALTWVQCHNNQLSSLMFNDYIERIYCSGNVLTCIDVNSTTNLTNLDCSNNMLEQLSIKNNNWLVLDVNALSNNLSCVEVDNLGYATNNWDIDGFASFSLDCNYANPCTNTTSIEEQTTNKELLKVTDILGRESDKKRNTPLFYIYNDGTVEKRIIIE